MLREQLGERIVALSSADFAGPVLEHDRYVEPNPEPVRGEVRHRDGSRRGEGVRPERGSRVSVRQTGRSRDEKSDARPARGARSRRVRNRGAAKRAGGKPERFSHNAAREVVSRNREEQRNAARCAIRARVRSACIAIRTISRRPAGPPSWPTARAGTSRSSAPPNVSAAPRWRGASAASGPGRGRADWEVADR